MSCVTVYHLRNPAAFTPPYIKSFGSHRYNINSDTKAYRSLCVYLKREEEWFDLNTPTAKDALDIQQLAHIYMNILDSISCDLVG